MALELVPTKRSVLVSAVVLGIALWWWQQRNARPKRGMELVRARNKGMHTQKSTLAGTIHFPVRPSDVFVVTYPKCGTTWVTQIVHQLRTKGHMDFKEITEVVPWDILALDCGQDLSQDHVANPRVFKSHESFEQIAKGARYIYVCRDPIDAFVSFYHFMPSAMGLPPGSLTMEEFADGIFAGVSNSGYIWNNMLGWWKHRHDPNVLFLCFEDLKEDLPAEVLRIATWLGYDPATEKERIDVAIANSSFEFMSAHASQFDDNFVFNKTRDAMGIPKGVSAGGVSKVRAGQVGGGAAVPQPILQRLHDRWRTVIAAETGLSSYADFRRALHQERMQQLA